MPTKFATSCPHCSRSLRVDEAKVGKLVRCPACREPFEVNSVQFSSRDSRAPSLEAMSTETTRNMDTSSGDATDSSGSHGRHEPTIGRIGRFELKVALGQGAFGTVYRAYDPILDRQVALKLPRGEFNEDKKRRRFVREAKAAASLHHPNIVAVFESGQLDGELFIASEFVDGTPMSMRVRDNRPSLRQAAEWVTALAEGLAYAHEFGIVHRDIKPDNIMISQADQPRIMDFGLAKRLDEQSSMTAEGGVLGTPAYMAPEQARGDTDNVGPHSDQYSLGVVLYELLTGQRPFSGPAHSVIGQVIKDDPVEPRRIRPEIPVDLAAICAKAMEKVPDRRYGHVREMAEDLEKWLAGRETLARPIGRGEKIMRWSRANPLIAAMTGITSALVVLVAVVSVIGYTVTNGALRRSEAAQADAVKAQKQAVAARSRAETLLAESYLERGRTLCLSGKNRTGLLWLSRALQSAENAPESLQELIRLNLDDWRPEFPVHRLDFQPAILSTLSPDKKTFATGYHSGAVKLIDAHTGQPICEPLPHQDVVLTIEFTPDGSLVLTGGREPLIRVWNCRNGEMNGTPISHPGRVHAISVHPTEQRFISVSSDPHVHVWDLTSREKLRESIPVGERSVYSLAYSPDGKIFATGGSDKTARLWDSETGQPVGNPMNHGGVVQALAFSPDGRILTAGCTDGKTYRWNLSGYKLVAPPIEEGGWFSPHAFGRDQNAMLVVSPGQYLTANLEQDLSSWGVTLWDLAEQRPLGDPFEHLTPVSMGVFAGDGNSVITSTSSGVVWSWDVSSVYRKRPLGKVHSAGVRAVAFSPDDSLIATASQDGTARLWDAETVDPRGEPMKHDGWIRTLAFSPDGAMLATGGRDGKIRFWGSQSAQQLPGEISSNGFFSIAFSPDGTTILAGENGNSHTTGWAQQWDVETKLPIGDRFEHQMVVPAVAYSPDGLLCATSSNDQTTVLWNSETGEQIAGPFPHTAAIRAVDFSPDGRLIAVGGYGTLVRLWDWNAGETVGSDLQHPESVLTLAFSPDGKLLATGGDDGYLRFWLVETGVQVGQPRYHSGRVLAVSFSHDGREILTGCADGSVTRGDVPAPVEGSAREVSDWVGSVTGLKLGSDGVARPVELPGND